MMMIQKEMTCALAVLCNMQMLWGMQTQPLQELLASMRIDDCEVLLQEAATKLSGQEIEQLQQIDIADVKILDVTREPGTIAYTAKLRNGDYITAEKFMKEPHGKFYCCMRHVMQGKKRQAYVPLDKAIFLQLHGLYEDNRAQQIKQMVH